MKTNNFSMFPYSRRARFDEFDDPKCIWVEKFNDAGLRSFYFQFMALEADDTVQVIPIVISSYGGHVYTAFAMRDIIKSSPKPVATIALGKAMSCGAVLLAAGTPNLRFASEDTYMLIHEISSGMQGKTHDLQVETRFTVGLNKRMLQCLASDTGQSIQSLRNHMDKLKNADWVLTATQAKTWGIVDHIGVPRVMDQAPMRRLVAGHPFTRSDLKRIYVKPPAKRPPKK